MRAGARLGLFWLAHTSRALADWVLRFLTILWLADGSAGDQAAWHVATVAFVAPFLLLAPFNGAISNAFPRRWVLVKASAFILLALLVCALLPGSWLLCLALTAIGSAIHSAARYAMIPAAAHDAGLPLPRVNSWLEIGAAAGILGGVLLAQRLGPGELWTFPLLFGLNVFCLAACIPLTFPSDTLRREPARQAVAGFFRDLARIARKRTAWAPLIGLASLQALVTATSGALVLLALSPEHSSGRLVQALLLIAAGAVVGNAVASLQGNPRRSLGLVPPGCALLLAGLGWAFAATRPGAPLPLLPCLLLGFAIALVNAPLRAAYLLHLPADARGNGAAVMNAAIYLFTISLAGLLKGLISAGLLPDASAQLLFLGALAALGTLAAFGYLALHLMDLLIELALLPMYRIRGHGPGHGVVPVEGPLLIVSNHTAYLDPFWLGKVLPRRFSPMMTSYFYDLPVVRWVLAGLGVIRVQVGVFRREAPELQQAVEILRRGGCVMIFPEALLRRTEEQLLRPFGQGVWHILREVPETPVIVCWIEGGWGSFASYKGGPPFRNKGLDWGRRIAIGMRAPAPLPSEVLADQRATRTYLARACLGCRAYLGLEVPAEPADVPAPAGEG